MIDQFYAFEHGSGSTWSLYIVPVSSATIQLTKDGRINVLKLPYASVNYDGVDPAKFVVVSLKDVPKLLETVRRRPKPYG